MTEKPSESRKVWRGYILAFTAAMALVLSAVPVSAITFNMSGIVVVMTNVSSIILPQFLSLIIAALPVIVVLAIVAFIVGFLDKILGMLKL